MASLKTYFLNFVLDDFEPQSMEMPLTSLVQQPYLEHAAILGIYNDDGSNVRLRIRRVEIDSLTGQSQDLPVALEFHRISALSGGTDITISKMDTANPDLPSVISIRKNLDSLTTTNLIRRQIVASFLNFTRANANLPDFSLGQTRIGLNDAEQIHAGYIDVQTQGWILREGEGLGLKFSAPPIGMNFQLYCLFSTEDGTYFLQSGLQFDGLIPPFAILNGIGSGKTVTVKQLELQEIGDDSVPMFSFERIDGLFGGEDLAPMKLDSSIANLPTQVLIKRKPVVLLAGHKTGAIISNPSFRQVMESSYGTGPGMAGVDMIGVNKFQVFIDSLDSQYVDLREGQGIAILKNTASVLGKFEVSITILREDISAGSPGLTETKVANDMPMTYVKTGKAEQLSSKVG